jgi:hypothetical protein
MTGDILGFIIIDPEASIDGRRQNTTRIGPALQNSGALP